MNSIYMFGALSTESIAHQDDKAFKLFCADMKVMRESNDAKELAEATAILESDIKRITGMNVQLKIEPEGFNAYTIIPDLTVNHALFKDLMLQTGADGFKLIKSSKQPLKGKIDRVNACVSGVFSEIPLVVHLSVSLIKGTMF